MQFNSLQFAVFFAITYGIYLFLGKRWQNALLLAASYIFYSFWDWRFLFLIAITTLLNYYLGLKIGTETSDRKRKKLIVAAVTINIGMLAVFKYADFFINGFQDLLLASGLNFSRLSISIVLPLGISFYTFMVMSYTIDIYRGTIKPTRNILDFALFVSFFPMMIAGPVERARNMLPQISSRRVVNSAKISEGAWLILWGLYKKIVIADNLARVTGPIFGSIGTSSGSEILLGIYAFTLQVYADFSGYTDMARGLAKLMGFDLIMNFRVPFLSRNVSDLWRRWHISLTDWIKEYIFYPLALARFRGKQLSAPLVIVLTWAIMGLWHGPESRYIFWGIYHGGLIVLYSKLRPYLRIVRTDNRVFSNIILSVQTFSVFTFFALGITFFAVPSTSDVFYCLWKIFNQFGAIQGISYSLFLLSGIVFLPFILVEFCQFRSDDEMIIFKWPLWLRVLLCYLIFYTVIMYGDLNAREYFYAQF